MNTHQIPADVLADLLEIPEFAQRVKVQKIYRGNSLPRESTARKGLIVNFRDMLQGHSARDLGDPPAPVLLAPAATTRPTDAQLQRTTPEKWSPQSTTTLGARGANSPKAPPAASVPSHMKQPQSFQDLQTAITEAVTEEYRKRQAEEFNKARSAFARIRPTQKSDLPATSGSGSAWALRNLGGRMAAAVLGSTARKSDAPTLPGNSGFRPMTGASLKG